MGGSRRADRIDHIKSLGRIAYRHLRQAPITGVITIDGDKHLREIEEGSLAVRLLEPFRPWAMSTETSRIEIRCDGRKVLDIYWDRAGYFRCATYEAGAWERELIGWPEPIPFD